ncbi:MAG: GTPase HflX [Myxococcales bacterium]|nr:GTPase HflX [Myxococcales bacterium]
MTSTPVHGDTANLKPAHARALGRLVTREVPAEQVISQVLARDLLELSETLGRQVGLSIDRRGRVLQVILGDAHSVTLPEFTRARGAAGRLGGVRLIVTHLVPDPLSREELADLAKLRLDLIAALHLGPAGAQVDLASLAPPPPGSDDAFTVRTWPRVPLSLLTRAAEGEAALERGAGYPVPFPEFIRALEGELVARRSRARLEVKGTRAMVLHVHTGGLEVEARQHEMRELCRTGGVHLVELCEQRRKHPDPRTFFGQGKLRELLVRALEQDVELLICDPDLTPSQARVIAELTDLKVIDRTTLILDIFAQHAKSADGKLQVELAQLRYRLPQMVGRGVMMSRLAGGIGGRGPGETKLEIDRRRAKSRITELERQLERLRKQRATRRSRRVKSGVPVVAIVGYTNAGKSTLLNTVTGADVIAEDKLFATLDPTVRRLRFPRDRELVLLDTVGFIRDLPPALTRAFTATLEEVAEADLLLLVVDASDPDRDQQVRTVEGLLGEIGAGEVPRLSIYNKCDLLDADELAQREAAGERDAFFISAHERRSLRPLVSAIEEHLWERGRLERLESYEAS